MTITGKEKQHWHNEGQSDAKDDDPIFGGPWGSPFDSDGDFEEKDEAYRGGKDNYHNQKD